MSIWCEPRSTMGPPPRCLVPPPVAKLVHRLVAVLLASVASSSSHPLGQPSGLVHRPVPLAVDRRDPPEQLRFVQQLLAAEDVVRIAAALVADLEELARLAGGLDHSAGPFQRVGHLLLAVDVQPGVQAGDRMLGVPAVRRGHDHGVQALLLLEHLAVIFVGVGTHACTPAAARPPTCDCTARCRTRPGTARRESAGRPP